MKLWNNPSTLRSLFRSIKNSNEACRGDALIPPPGAGGGLGSDHSYQELKQLVQWGLVDARDDGERSVPFEIINKDSARDFTYSLSQNAREIEDVLEISLTAKPLFQRPQEENAPFDLFMLMPFKTELREVFFRYIEPLAKGMWLTAGRADNQSYSSNGAVINDIWSGIFHAKVIVADCTEQNPNVFYEIGIAHTLGKETILICREESSFAFDVNYLRIILYRNTKEGMKELEASLKIRIEQSLLKQGFRLSKK